MVHSPASAALPFDGQYFLDRLTFFHGVLHLSGWVNAPDGASLSLVWADDREVRLLSFGMPSPDLIPHFGPQAAHARFDERVTLSASVEQVAAARLIVRRRDGQPQEIRNLGQPAGDAAHALSMEFRQRLLDLDLDLEGEPCMLEIGSRARSGIVRHEYLPPGWT